MLSDILTGLKVLFPAQAWSGRDFLNFVGGWEWGYIFSLMIEHPFPMNFYFARLFFFPDLRNRGVERGGERERKDSHCVLYLCFFCLVFACTISSSS